MAVTQVTVPILYLRKMPVVVAAAVQVRASVVLVVPAVQRVKIARW